MPSSGPPPWPRSAARSSCSPAPSPAAAAATELACASTASVASPTRSSPPKPRSPIDGSSPTGRRPGRRWVRARHRGAPLKGPRRAKPRGRPSSPRTCASLRRSPAPTPHSRKGAWTGQDALDFHPYPTSSTTSSRDERQAPQLRVEAVVALGLREPGDPLGGGRERDAVTGQAGADRDGDREMALAGAGRAQEDDVLLGVQEVELAEVLDDLAADRALEGEVELLERLAGGEARGLDPALAAVALARGDLGGEQGFGEALVAPALFARPLGEPGQRAGGGRGLERPAQVGELGGLGHAGIRAS